MRSKISQKEAKLFNPPVEWLIIQFVIAFATGSYAMEDLNTYGRQILLRSRTRLRWWISKCLWATLTAVFCYIVLYATVAIGSFISGDSLSPMVNEQLVLQGNLRTVNVGLEKKEFMISLYINPSNLLFSLAWSKDQVFVML